MHHPLLSTVELVQQMQAKSRRGAEALYDEYAKVLGLVIFRILCDRHQTDLILEKTIHHIWNSADQYNEQQAPLLAWMLGIAKNLALQQIVTNKPAVTAPVVFDFKQA
jgi:DNA-directed RNA polymerase specialized sigma24 family protein